MNQQELSSWIVQFPISLAVEGPDCYRRMAQCGIESVILCCTIYSPYRLVLPRYPSKGIYSMEEGRYYYNADPARYEDLPVSPVPSEDFGGRDLVEEMSREAAKAGLKSAAWISMFANGRIAKQHPQWAVHNLYDSADRMFLCFNNPQVREYSLRVCEEVAGRYPLDEIMLDKIPQTCLELDASAGRIDPVLRVVGSFCFCPHCVAAAKSAGIDLESCREQARLLAAQSLAIPAHVVNALEDDLRGDTEAPLLLVDHPWIVEVLRWRMACVRDFLREVRERIDVPRKGVRMSICFVPPVKSGHDASSPRSWLAAQSYAAYKDAAADMIHAVVHCDKNVVEYDTRRAVDAVAGGTTKITTHLRAYGRTAPDELPGLVEAVRRGGAAGVGYFCYDYMSEEMLEAVERIQRGR